ncbi:hypothetical protein O6H91_21G032300 [Diphasiastrum complanatum]|uniref:Uncharacterized protein n=1 Tax=Diphasiastrum complanatum TaxID=34168 RepID=A0ACC2AJ93_DIPCM|nr:hypothetical protein O6H91_21G032300 [Diphasiastrum complanatum]
MAPRTRGGGNSPHSPPRSAAGSTADPLLSAVSIAPRYLSADGPNLSAAAIAPPHSSAAGPNLSAVAIAPTPSSAVAPPHSSAAATAPPQGSIAFPNLSAAGSTSESALTALSSTDPLASTSEPTSASVFELSTVPTASAARISMTITNPLVDYTPSKPTEGLFAYDLSFIRQEILGLKRQLHFFETENGKLVQDLCPVNE